MASSIKTIAVLVLAPIADYYKVYNTLALASPIILTFSYAFSMFISPVVPFVLYGISEALAHISMWTCLAQAVPKKKIVRSRRNLVFFCSKYAADFQLSFTSALARPVFCEYRSMW